VTYYLDHPVYLHALAETWSEVWGDEVGALAPKIFLPSPPKCEIWRGTAGDSLYSVTAFISRPGQSIFVITNDNRHFILQIL